MLKILGFPPSAAQDLLCKYVYNQETELGELTSKVVISNVEANSVAYKLGLVANDVITVVNAVSARDVKLSVINPMTFWIKPVQSILSKLVYSDSHCISSG